MDHKDFFENFGHITIQSANDFAVIGISLEVFYQVSKARLIEELRTETMKNEYGQPSFLRLIDTTGDANGR